MKNGGIVYWICGLAGSGKTSVAEKFYKLLKKKELLLFYLTETILEKRLIYQKIIPMKEERS